jgi:hypothetical protein
MDDILDVFCTKPGILTACSVTPALDTVKVGRSKQVKLIFTAGPASGTGVAVVNADGNVELQATDTIKLNPIKVTPKGGTIEMPPDTTYTQSFTVKNLGNVADTVNLAKTCGASLTCTLITSSPMALAAGATGTANVSVTTMGSGTSGPVTLSAIPLHGIGGDAATVTVNVPIPLPPTVSSSPHNGYNRSTALCATSCFNVTAGYATPAYTSLDVPRSARVRPGNPPVLQPGPLLRPAACALHFGRSHWAGRRHESICLRRQQSGWGSRPERRMLGLGRPIST